MRDTENILCGYPRSQGREAYLSPDTNVRLTGLNQSLQYHGYSQIHFSINIALYSDILSVSLPSFYNLFSGGKLEVVTVLWLIWGIDTQGFQVTLKSEVKE